MYRDYSNNMDNGQKIPFLSPKHEGVYNFSFKNHKCGVGRQEKIWVGGSPAKPEGWRKTGEEGGRAGFEWEEEFTR